MLKELPEHVAGTLRLLEAMSGAKTWQIRETDIRSAIEHDLMVFDTANQQLGEPEKHRLLNRVADRLAAKYSAEAAWRDGTRQKEVQRLKQIRRVATEEKLRRREEERRRFTPTSAERITDSLVQLSAGMNHCPQGRPIRDFQDAEERAAEWMRQLGYSDAKTTPPGADGGIDVASKEAVAQVKFEAKRSGRVVVQNLVGSAAVRKHRTKQKLFFANGFSELAVAYADEVGVALFRFDNLGDISACNRAARRLLSESDLY